MSKKILLALIVLSLCLVFLPVLARDEEIPKLGEAGTEKVATFPTVEFPIAIKRVTDIVFYALLLIALIMIIYAGIQFATAGGAPEKIELARHMVMYGLIAIVVGAIAWGMVNIVYSYMLKGRQ